jgi:hypothetical protein
MHRALIEELEQLDDEDLNDPARIGELPPGSKLWMVLEQNTWIHYLEHTEALLESGVELAPSPPQPDPPQPDPPPTAAALAEAVRAAYVQLNDELAACFAGVSEAAADYRPAPGAWSAKELVAHCILCERDLQSWIAAWLLDIETANNLEGRPNVQPRLAALVAVYGSIPALLQQFRHSAEETIALLAGLPAEFVGRKHLYQRASDAPMGNVEHVREHFEQIRAAIAAAL